MRSLYMYVYIYVILFANICNICNIFLTLEESSEVIQTCIKFWELLKCGRKNKNKDFEGRPEIETQLCHLLVG